MSDYIEIWKSITGNEDADFSLLTQLPDISDSVYFQPAIPHILYLYKARRFSETNNRYSNFSPIVYARGHFPYRGYTRMANNTNIGIQSKMGVQVEANEGTPVKVTRLVDRVSGNLEMELAVHRRRSLRNITAAIGAVPGAAKISGNIVVEPTPEGISQLLCSFLGAPINTPVAQVTGPPLVAAHSINTWYDQLSTTVATQLPITISERRGQSLFCFPGCRASALDIRVNKTQAEPITFQFDFMGLNQLVYVTESDLGLDTAGFDPLNAFSSVLASVTLAGAVTTDANSIDLRLTKNLGERQVLNGKRGANGHYIQHSEHTGNATLYFSTENELKRYFGQASIIGSTVAYGANNMITYLPISLTIGSDIDPTDNYAKTITVNLPNACYTRVGEPLQGPDAIMQNIQIEAYHDAATNSSLNIAIVNNQSLSAIQAGVTPGASAVAVASVPTNNIF